jgi:hypothetical protein
MSPAWGMTTIFDLLSNTCKNHTRPFEALLVQWIKTGWNDISADTMVKSFKGVKESMAESYGDCHVAER